jgi:hypothetical protein
MQAQPEERQWLSAAGAGVPNGKFLLPEMRVE